MISKRVSLYLNILCAIFLGIVYLMIPWPRSWAAGVYNPNSGWIWCTTQTACIHEVGHKLDHEAGWISQSEEFGVAVQKYVAAEFRYGDPPSYLATKILTMPNAFIWDRRRTDPQHEIYATIFQLSEGKKENMPPEFWQFYDWQRAEELLKEYDQ